MSTTAIRARIALLLLAGIAGTVARAGELITDKLNVTRQADLNGDVTVSAVQWSTNGALLHFTFDNDDEPPLIRDAGALANDGEAYGGYALTNGHSGGGLLLDGYDGQVEAPPRNEFKMTNYTLAAWIKTSDAGNSRRRIVSQQYGGTYWLMALNANVLEFGSSGAGVLTTKGSALNDNNWHHVAVTRDSIAGQARWQVDGSVVGVESFSSTTGDNTDQKGVFVGCVHDQNEFFTGLIDDVMVFGRALATNEVKALYQQSTNALISSGSLSVNVSATFSQTTTILRLQKQGDIEMGVFTNHP